MYDAIDPDGLKRVLAKRPLLEEEIRMWLLAGFYIEPSSLNEADENEKWTIWDYQGQRAPLTKYVGHNLKLMVVTRWERAKHPNLFPENVDPPLTEEEIQNLNSLQERSNHD
jgi:hypothetical protein